MNFFDVKNKKTNKTQYSETPKKAGKSPQEQIAEINKKIEELRESLDIYTSPKEFARIQEEIRALENRRYQIMAKDKLQ